MIVIGKFHDVASAEVAQSALEANGIPAWIPDSNLAGLAWTLGTALGGVRLQVREEDAEAAAALLAPLDEPEDIPETEGVRQRCPNCRSEYIVRDDQRRLKVAMMLFWPFALVALPLLFSRWGRMKCGECGKTWRPTV